MMLPKKEHIILKKHKGITTLWLAEEYLIEATGVSYDYLLKNRHITKAWDFKTINGIRYYNYNTIPNRKPTYYRSQLPNIDELLDVAENKATKVADYHDYFELALTNYLAFSKYYSNIDQEHKVKLCKSAAVVAYTLQYIHDTGYNTKKFQLFDEMAALISEYQLSYIPMNRRRIKEKILLAEAGTPINEIVKMPRIGNANASKYIDDSQIEKWIYELASNPKNFSDAYIIRKITELCNIQGRKIPSQETIRQKLVNRETRFLTSVIRHGTGTRAAADYEGTIPIASAPFAGDCWQVDATRINMIGHERTIHIDGKTIKTVSNLMVCAVIDIYSGCCLGYSFDYAENHAMIANALKMAVTTAGYLPYEIVMDRYPGHNKPEGIALRETLETMGVKITITHKPTSKGVIERWFNTMQQVEMQGSDYYYGEGIKSTHKFAHVSPEYLANIKKKAKQEGYSLHDTIVEYSGMIEVHNARLYSEYSKKYRFLNNSPKLLHDESDKPNVQFVNSCQINHLFGGKTDLKVPANGILELTFRHLKHYYLIEDYNIIANYPRVCVSYDPENMESVEVYRHVKDSTWLIHLCTAKQFTPINVYGPQAEFNKLQKIKQHQQKIEAKRLAKLQEKLNIETEENDIPNVFEYYNDESEMNMGMHTIKKAAGDFEDIEINGDSAKRSIYKQLFNNNNNT